MPVPQFFSIFQVVCSDFGKRAVHIPFNVFDVVFAQQFIQKIQNVFLHFRFCHVQHKLIAHQVRLSRFVMICPVRMLSVKFGKRVHHFRFYPDAEIHTQRIYAVNQGFQPAREFQFAHIPVAQSGSVRHAA